MYIHIFIHTHTHTPMHRERMCLLHTLKIVQINELGLSSLNMNLNAAVKRNKSISSQIKL